MQAELNVARGEIAQSSTRFEMLKADFEAMQSSRQTTQDELEREVSELHARLADSLGEKAGMQGRVRELEHDKCQLCIQVRYRHAVYTS